MSLAIPLAYALFSSAPAFAAYNLAQEYSGSKFFDGWDWQDHVYDDTTHGKSTSVSGSIVISEC